MVTALSCHSECSYCDGPTENDCLACSKSPYYTPVDGKCVLKCPDGYFKQIDTSNNEPKCVTICKFNQYGNPVTQACIDSCPSPKYADSKNWLCVDTCSDPN